MGNRQEETLIEKYHNLLQKLRKMGSVAVAFSGGIDSTFLLRAASEAIPQGVMAITAHSVVHPARDILVAKRIAKEMSVCQILFPSREMDIHEFSRNHMDRCYHCKRYLFSAFWDIARDNGVGYLLHGANVDDLAEIRPGMRAAREQGVIAPLVDVGFSKGEIRAMSKKLGLSNWARPSSPCLATRIPHGTPITAEKLRVVERAEVFLHDMGFDDLRVRHLGETALIEVKREDIPRLLDPAVHGRVTGELNSLGWVDVKIMGRNSG